MSGSGGFGGFISGGNAINGASSAAKTTVTAGGATQLAGGVAGVSNRGANIGSPGASLTGGNAGTVFGSGNRQGSGGGGAGYFGGGGGATAVVFGPLNQEFETGGGGGSGFVTASMTQVSSVDGLSTTETNPTEIDYNATIRPGKGGNRAQNGSNGMVVIYWIP